MYANQMLSNKESHQMEKIFSLAKEEKREEKKAGVFWMR